jgi:hypothetical protein
LPVQDYTQLGSTIISGFYAVNTVVHRAFCFYGVKLNMKKAAMTSLLPFIIGLIIYWPILIAYGIVAALFFAAIMAGADMS